MSLEQEIRSQARSPRASPPEVERIRPRSGLSRAEVIASQRGRAFYERFESKELCFAAAFEDGVERLVVAVVASVDGESSWDAQVSAGLRAGLNFLAAGPALAHLLLVEALAAARPARLEYERSLVRLAEALRATNDRISAETARLLAGGLVSHLSGRLLAGESGRLPEDHTLLLRYLTAPGFTGGSQVVAEQPIARA